MKTVIICTMENGTPHLSAQRVPAKASKMDILHQYFRGSKHDGDQLHYNKCKVVKVHLGHRELVMVNVPNFERTLLGRLLWRTVIASHPVN